MSRVMKKRSAKAGLPPGSLVYIGSGRSPNTRITLIDYDESTVTERELRDIAECLAFKSSRSVTWINVDETKEPGLVADFGKVLGFHPLMQEDILATDQRAKVEDHGDYLYVVLKMLSWDAARDEMAIEQMSLVLGGTYVITFQEEAGDFFDPLRARIVRHDLPAGQQVVRQIRAIAHQHHVAACGARRFGPGDDVARERRALHGQIVTEHHALEADSGAQDFLYPER